MGLMLVTNVAHLSHCWTGMDAKAGAARQEARGHGVDLEPETILPVQFSAGGTLDASLQPEKRLMLAVLEEGVGTFQKYALSNDRAGQRLFQEAEEWFESDEVEWPYAFVNICHTLGIDVDYLRGGLRRWRQQQHEANAAGGKVIRFPFRRVNGTRHSVTGRAPGLRQSA
jgi:hypothetical protein